MATGVRVLDGFDPRARITACAWGHPSFEFVWGDVRDPASVATALEGVWVVVHLAAIVGDPACQRPPSLHRRRIAHLNGSRRGVRPRSETVRVPLDLQQLREDGRGART